LFFDENTGKIKNQLETDIIKNEEIYDNLEKQKNKASEKNV